MKEKNTYKSIYYTPVSVLSERIIVINFLFLLAGYIISTITGAKIHYLITLCSSFLILFINFKIRINTSKFVYLFSLTLSTLHFLFTKPADTSFIFSLFTYFLIPITFFNYRFKSFNLNAVVGCFNLFTTIYFVGLLMQLVGVSSPFLTIDLTYTDGVLHDRYGSFAGGTLGLGFAASISSIASFYKIIYERNRNILNVVVLFISVFTLVLAQSRRFYFFVLIIYFFIYFFDLNKNYDLKKIFRIAITASITIALAVVGLFLLKDNSYYVMRLFSTLDTVNDESNVIRIGKWLTAIDAFLNNFWFGLGLGTTATIGKDLANTYIDDLFVAESYYLKGFVEGGFIFGITFLGLCIKFLRVSFKNLRVPQKALAGYFFLFFFLDSFVSTSLESVISSIIFWLCLSILNETEETSKQSDQSIHNNV